MVRGLLAVAIAVTFLLGLGQALTTANTPADVLAQRARAVLAKDEQAFHAGLDPEAPQEDQLRLFRDLTALPLQTWEYRDENTLVYALEGIDPHPVTKTVHHEFVQRGNRWYVTGTTPDDFDVHTSAAGLVISHPSHAALATRIRDELPSAVAAVTEVWGEDWTRKVAIVVPRTTDNDLAGVAIAAQTNPPTGQRVVINAERAAPLSSLELRVLIRHEITHVAARAYTASQWLTEGFADYVAFRGTGLPLKAAAPLLTSQVTELPRDFTGPGRDLAYQQAYSLCAYLAEQRGERGLVDLYRSESEVDIPVADWRAFLEKHIG